MIVQPNLTGRISSELRKAWELLAAVINGRINFGNGILPANIDGVWVSFKTAGANQLVTHNLGRIPVGYIVAMRDAPVNIFTGIGAWTVSIMYLQSDMGGSQVSLFVF